MAESNNLANQVVQRVAEHARHIAGQIADNIGTPVDASKLSRSEIARLWNLPNPQANPMQVQQLLMAGQHAQAVDLQYPWRSKLIGQGDPERMVQRAQQFASMAQPEEVST